MKEYFTSESVSEGHPDKAADRVSDAILDAYLAQDPEAHVACETMLTNNVAIVAGEVKSIAKIDVEEVVRHALASAGYDRDEVGFNGFKATVYNMLHAQSADIDQGVSGTAGASYPEQQGAGDQGIMFGYACDDTFQCMPAPIFYAHRILQVIRDLRRSKYHDQLFPDGKSQVTFLYEDGRPVALDTVVVSNQHSASVDQKFVFDVVKNEVLPAVFADTPFANLDNIKLYVNPTGRFVIGGPVGDTGLTGRKIIVDTYGGMGRHGGGAFSGKDPSKVDRSAAYAARHAAKNVVAAGLASRCEIQLSYAIGVPYPISVLVEAFGTENKVLGLTKESLSNAVKELFDFTPAGIVDRFGLKYPGDIWSYMETSSYGHFGRYNFPWENLDFVDLLQKRFHVPLPTEALPVDVSSSTEETASTEETV